MRLINERLARREARARAIIEAIAEGVAVASKDGCLEVFNRAATQIVGVGLVETDQDQWSSIYGLYLPDGKTPCPTERLPLVRAIKGEHVEAIPLVVQHPEDERPVHLSVTASPLYDDDGVIDGGVAIFQDVTERVISERLLCEARNQLELRIKELKASEQKYQDLYENAPDMYLTVDATSGKILECNQTLANTTGFDKSEIVGSSIYLLHDPSCIDQITEAFESFRERGVFPNSDFTLIGKDNRRIEVSLNVSAVLDKHNKVVRARCVWRDITKWKRAEEALSRHREELAHLTRVHTAGEMATGLAHELNQPLNAIVNYSRGFLRRASIGSTVTAELRGAAEEMIRESERASSIIEGLRRLVAKQTPDHATTDLNQVIQDAITMCRGEAQRQGVVIERHFALDLPEIPVDAVQIKQVVICLILNALESLGDTAANYRRVIVTTKRNSENTILIDVEDNGKGITAEESEKVFEAFYSTKSNGMGMGLAISRSIIENHGGRIWNHQKPLPGTSFCISLPVTS
ncbi:MAG: PAS domain S-box protein [Planctomycetales bacterium]|nr:PAS domain S-box protein [Planctomycetales bacterium]